MSGKSINFDDKKINKSYLYKNKKLFKIGNVDVSKKNHMVQKRHLNILLGMMVMMLLDPYQ